VVEDTSTSGARSFKDLEELGSHLLAPIPPLPASLDADEPDIPPIDGD
jgi:hypothetical protein